MSKLPARRWSDDEVRSLRHRADQGQTAAEIAKGLSRTPRAVQAKARAKRIRVRIPTPDGNTKWFVGKLDNLKKRASGIEIRIKRSPNQPAIEKEQSHLQECAGRFRFLKGFARKYELAKAGYERRLLHIKHILERIEAWCKEKARQLEKKGSSRRAKNPIDWKTLNDIATFVRTLLLIVVGLWEWLEKLGWVSVAASAVFV